MKARDARAVGRVRVRGQSAAFSAEERRYGFRGSAEDAQVMRRLLEGDQATFETLVQRHHRAMVRVAASMGASEAVAEELAQEAWEGFLEGLETFEGRCSLRTWLFRILINRTKTRDAREKRSVPFEGLGDQATDDLEPASAIPRAPELTGALLDTQSPEEMLCNAELRRALEAAITALPTVQRTVLVMRDVAELDAPEVCRALDITEANQRVLLHRARIQLRDRLAVFWRGR